MSHRIGVRRCDEHATCAKRVSFASSMLATRKEAGPMDLSVTKSISLGETSKASDRRGKIVGALYRCMSKKGYAATTLCDIAEEAGMTSSHLLYYYPGKEAILGAFFKTVTKRLEKQMSELKDREPAERIEAIADLFLNPKGMRKIEQGVILDLYGQAVQNKSMRRLKVAHDRRIKDLFVDLFSQLPKAPTASAEDCAQIAYAVMFGLHGSSFYDPQLGAAQANRLFKQTLFQLAGLKEPAFTPDRA
jgi:AcrR family transcriptional regulator